ncbi:MAG: winged helix DNA-binding protein [Ignavibacteria bacterium]|nr:winged helix DNA-binding protein [Ignavibacteria bacterium]
MESKIIDHIFLLKQKCLQTEIEINTEMGLSYREIIGIGALKENETIDCNTLSEMMGLSKSRGSRVIDKLITKGYLSRKVSDFDRRAVEISLTEKGVICKKSIEMIKKKCEKKIEENLNNQQKKTIKEGLKILNEIL